MDDTFFTTSPWFKLSKNCKHYNNYLKDKINEYIKLGIKKTYNKDSQSLIAGDIPQGVFYIERGVVQTTVVGRNGTEKILSISGKGCFIGEEILFHNQPALYNAFAITDVEVYMFERNAFLKILEKDFIMSYEIMYSMAIRVRVLANQIEDLLFRSTLEKVCRVLYYYAEMSHKASIPISHQNIATLIGVHRVSVSNVLAELKEEGIVSSEYGKIIIKNKEALKEIIFKDFL